MRKIGIHTSIKALTALLLATGFSACQMREVSPFDDQAHISIDVDWSNMDQQPTGMTVYFYPENGRPPYTYFTNDVTHIEKSLPEMNYEIMIFNQTIEEFSSFSFRGMENINTAEIYSPEEDDKFSLLDKLYQNGGRAYSKSKQIQPRIIAAGKETVSRPTRGYTGKKVIKPVLKVGQLTATIHVKGLTNVKKANGALSGLASGAYLTLDKLSSPSLIQEMSEWSIDDSGNIGTISTIIGTFGLSPSLDHNRAASESRTVNGGRFIEPTTEDESRNILYLNFLLKDNTYVAYRFDVTDFIKDFTTEAEVELVLDLGTDVEEYITIPETGIPYDDVPVTVQPWGQEEIDHNITL